MTLTNVAPKLMHASSFAARFNKGSAHHADIVRIAQELHRSSIPPVLPPAIACWVGDALESGMSVRFFLLKNVDYEVIGQLSWPLIGHEMAESFAVTAICDCGDPLRCAPS